MSTAKRIVISYATRKRLNLSVVDSSVTHIQNKVASASTSTYIQWRPINHHKIDKTILTKSGKDITP
jgi:hypothetical protein